MSISWPNLISYLYTTQPNGQIPALLFTSTPIGYVCGILQQNATSTANLYGVALAVSNAAANSVNVSYKNLTAPSSAPWAVNTYPNGSQSQLLANLPSAIYSNNGTFVYFLSLNASDTIQNVTSAYQISGPPSGATFTSIPTCVANILNAAAQVPPPTIPPAKLNSWADVAQFLTVLPVSMLPWVIFTTNKVPDQCNITAVYQQTSQLFNTSPTNFLANNNVSSIYVTDILNRNTPVAPVQGFSVNISGNTYTMVGLTQPLDSANLAASLSAIANTPGNAYMYLIYTDLSNVYNDGVAFNVNLQPLQCQVVSQTGASTQTAGLITNQNQTSGSTITGGQTANNNITQVAGSMSTSSSKKWLWIVLAIVVVLIILGLIGFFIYRSRAKKATV